MPAPTYPQVAYGWALRNIMEFGGLPSPVGKNMTGNNMTYIDLNDGVNWFAQGLSMPDSKKIVTAQELWLARGIYIAEDYEALTVKIPFIFEEGGGKTLASERAKLLTAGIQQLTFDNRATAFLAKAKSLGEPTAMREGVPPLSWKGVLEFLVLEPFFRDIAGSSMGATAFTQSVGGTATGFNINYVGSFRAEPTFPSVSANVGGNLTVVLQNTLTGESLTFTVPSDGSTYVVDCTATGLKVTKGAVFYDVTGAFPQLWPQLNSVGNNTFTITATGAASSAATIAAAWNNRWLP